MVEILIEISHGPWARLEAKLFNMSVLWTRTCLSGGVARQTLTAADMQTKVQIAVHVKDCLHTRVLPGKYRSYDGYCLILWVYGCTLKSWNVKMFETYFQNPCPAECWFGPLSCEEIPIFFWGLNWSSGCPLHECSSWPPRSHHW